MKITSKLKKKIEELSQILKYGTEWADSSSSAYTAGAIEGAAFIVSCKIVQEILIPAKTELDSLGAGEVVDITDLFNNPSLADLKESLTEFLSGVE